MLDEKQVAVLEDLDAQETTRRSASSRAGTVRHCRMSRFWAADRASTIVTDEQIRRNVLNAVSGTFRIVLGTGHIADPNRSTM